MSFAFERLRTVVEQEASLLGGLCDEVREIKEELDSMRRLLQDADRKRASNEMEKNWVEQVRDVAYDVEDIIDEFMHRFDRQYNGGVCNILHRAIHLPKDVIIRHQIATRLRQIKRRIESISKRKDRYPPMLENETRSLNDANKTWHYQMEISETAQMKMKQAELENALFSEEPQRMFISVVGMGGLGKTTLVDKVFKEKRVNDHFKRCAWIHVSQFYRIEEDILRGMIKELKAETAGIDNMNARQLKEKLGHHLQSEKYLVVLDDVWSTDVLASICSALPSNRHGSRVILTARNEDVSVKFALSDEMKVIKLYPLGRKDSWDLFSKKVFRKEPCPPELKEWARKIVKKCEGLPLAIVAMGGILASRQKTAMAWRQVYGSLTWHLNNNEMLKNIGSILFISYNDLPYYLKPCFLYCCVFPENQLIQRKRLIRLWVAQGFVEERGSMTREEVAEEYLLQLALRSMIQVVKTNEFGRIRAFRIHNLLREMALSKCKEESFITIYTGQEKLSNASKIRHLAVHRSGEIPRNHIIRMRQLRSFFIFDNNMPSSSSLHAILSSFKFLRVLDLGEIPIDSLPNEVTNLFNLRHLDLRGTNVEELPKSIGRLRNLHTLDTRDTKIEKLPNELAKLQKLRHLLVGDYQDSDIFSYMDSFCPQKGVLLPNNICDLRELISLLGVEANEEFASKVGDLSHLRRLGVRNLREVDGEELSKSITKLTNLVHLKVASVNEEELLNLEALSSPPPDLQKLSLYGRLENMPHWFGSLTSLTHLELCWSELWEDPLPSLELLPNLLSLILLRAQGVEDQEYHSNATGFPKLKKFGLLCPSSDVDIVIQEGTMPNLHTLVVMYGNNSCVSFTPPKHNYKILQVQSSFSGVDDIREFFKVDP